MQKRRELTLAKFRVPTILRVPFAAWHHLKTTCYSIVISPTYLAFARPVARGGCDEVRVSGCTQKAVSVVFSYYHVTHNLNGAMEMRCHYHRSHHRRRRSRAIRIERIKDYFVRGIVREASVHGAFVRILASKWTLERTRRLSKREVNASSSRAATSTLKLRKLKINSYYYTHIPNHYILMNYKLRGHCSVDSWATRCNTCCSSRCLLSEIRVNTAAYWL